MIGWLEINCYRARRGHKNALLSLFILIIQKEISATIEKLIFKVYGRFFGQFTGLGVRLTLMIKWKYVSGLEEDWNWSTLNLMHCCFWFHSTYVGQYYMSGVLSVVSSVVSSVVPSVVPSVVKGYLMEPVLIFSS